MVLSQSAQFHENVPFAYINMNFSIVEVQTEDSVLFHQSGSDTFVVCKSSVEFGFVLSPR